LLFVASLYIEGFPPEVSVQKRQAWVFLFAHILQSDNISIKNTPFNLILRFNFIL
jgi:hypothetical protein